MRIIQDIQILKDVVLKEIDSRKISIISVDGKDGSGKTTISKGLIVGDKLVHLNIDDTYLEKGKGGYVKSVKEVDLYNDIQKYKEKIVVIDGVCILEILSNINIIPELKIYIKKLDEYGNWEEAVDFDYTRDPEDIIHEIENDTRSYIESVASRATDIDIISDGKGSLMYEIIQYHHKYQPDINSDIIFESCRFAC